MQMSKLLWCEQAGHGRGSFINGLLSEGCVHRGNCGKTSSGGC